MVTVRDSIESGDYEEFVQVLTDDVVWVGLHPGELCRNRADVVEMFARARANGVQAKPEVVVERDDALVVDPHLDGRHHVLVLAEGQVSEVRVYTDRSAAVGALEARPW
jgi:ketosteroid isomerase-like protein